MKFLMLSLCVLLTSSYARSSEVDLGFVTVNGDLPSSFQDKLNKSLSDDLKDKYMLAVSAVEGEEKDKHEGEEENSHFRLSLRHKKDSEEQSISEETIGSAKEAFFKASSEQHLKIEGLWFLKDRMIKEVKNFKVTQLKKEGQKEVDVGDFTDALRKRLGKEFAKDYDVTLTLVGREVFQPEKKSDEKERVLSRIYDLDIHAKSDKKSLRPHIVLPLMDKIACTCSDFDLRPTGDLEDHGPLGRGPGPFGPSGEKYMNHVGGHHGRRDFHHCKGPGKKEMKEEAVEDEG